MSKKTTAISPNLWRPFIGEFAWKTVFLFCAALALLLASIYAATVEKLPYWASITLNSLAIYLLFTPAHEAVHGNIRGKHHKYIWLEKLIGGLSSLSFTAPYPVFKHVHLTHHNHTNHPEDDPDYFVKGENIFIVLIKCSFTVFFYHYHYWRYTKTFLKTAEGRKDFLITNLLFAFLWVVVISWGMLAGWQAPVLLWILPTWIATTFLALVFDWLPHHPHAVQKRYLDTRIILFPGLTTLLLSQNMHLIHHLYPSIPFYNYGKAFKNVREDLEEKGARIDDLSKRSSAHVSKSS